MNSNYTFTDLLDLWEKDALTTEELSVLSGRIDPEEVHHETTLHKAAILSIQKVAIAEQVSAVHQKYMARLEKPQPETKVIPLSQNKKTLRLVAAAAVFLGVFLSVDRLFVTPDLIYKSAYEDYFVNRERSLDNSSSNTLFENFRAENFQAVIQAFSNMQEPDAKARFLAGYSMMKEGKYADAKGQFEAILQDDNRHNGYLFRDEAEYYLALTLLNLKSYDKAYTLMTHIRNTPEHTYSDAFDYWDLLRLNWFY